MDEQWAEYELGEVFGCSVCTMELTFRAFGVVLEDPGLTMDVSLLSLGFSDLLGSHLGCLGGSLDISRRLLRGAF